MTLLKKMAAIESDLEEIKVLLKSQSQSQKQKEILTAHQTMELLGINRSTFNSWSRIGLIQVFKINRRLYCRYSQILSALENGLLERT